MSEHHLIAEMVSDLARASDAIVPIVLPNPFTVATWNIERGKQLASLLPFLKTGLRADVLLLQEVDRFTRRTCFRDVAAELAAYTRMQHVFGVEFLELAQGHDDVPAVHGNMTLSRSQIDNARILRFRSQPHDWGRIRLPIPWLQPREGGRMAVVAEVECQDRKVVFYNTHLESRASDMRRADQMAEILADISDHYPSTTPVIVAGDLNTKEGTFSPVVKALVDAGFNDVFKPESAPVATKPHGPCRLDWIFVRELAVLSASMPIVSLSDHYPIVAHLELFPVSAGVRSIPQLAGS